ncbi:unnamed protein product [Strongylus vulgaris]|uniref:Uncharacterized protein n=1 Tax=Strongylus vulgaris TaxID=40348 RepID=A0A3P7I9F2_STRVU|nr:unnamed protein product [Strongylus vulgaris]
MTTNGSQSARKRKKAVIVDLRNESDDEIVVVEERRPPPQPYAPTFDPYDPEENPQTFYAQYEIPEYHTRNLEKRINKESELFQLQMPFL